MKLFVRLFWLLIAARSRPRCDTLGPCRTPFRVLPTDLDLLGHVNNGVYLSMLDLARLDLSIRTGIARAMRENRWFGVVQSETIQFRRALTLGQRFEIETRVLGWDDKAFYFHHRFLHRSHVIAAGLVQIRILKKSGGSARPEEIMDAISAAQPSPALPDWLAGWLGGQRTLLDG